MLEVDTLPTTVKIKVPDFIDDPILGRYFDPFTPRIPLEIFHDYLIIDNETLTYQGLTRSTTKFFNLKDIAKILMEKRQISCFTKDFNLDFGVRPGIEISLSLVGLDGKRHVLIPSFFLDRGEQEWNRFLSELCRHTCLPLEEIIYQKK